MPVAWDSDHPHHAKRLTHNVQTVLRQIVVEATDRQAPTVDMAQQWHRDLYRGIELPVGYFAGEIRDSNPRFPELFGYEVQVGDHLGVLSSEVPAALAAFESAFAGAVGRVDEQLFDVPPSGLRRTPDSTEAGAFCARPALRVVSAHRASDDVGYRIVPSRR